jgi:hypothetical protein
MFPVKRRPCLGIRYPCTTRSTSSDDPGVVSARSKRRYSVPMYLIVDGQLVFENIVPSFIDGICSKAIVLLPSIDWAPFAVPDTQAVLIHPFPLPFVASLHSPSLFVGADIVLWTTGKTISTVVCHIYQTQSQKQWFKNIPWIEYAVFCHFLCISPKCEKSLANVFPSKKMICSVSTERMAS